jgi:hypothetical protein
MIIMCAASNTPMAGTILLPIVNHGNSGLSIYYAEVIPTLRKNCIFFRGVPVRK